MRDRFSECVYCVEREHERVVVTRNGRPAAVLISPDDLQSLEETLAILADSETVRGIREGRDAIRAGDFIEGVDAIAVLRATR